MEQTDKHLVIPYAKRDFLDEHLGQMSPMITIRSPAVRISIFGSEITWVQQPSFQMLISALHSESYGSIVYTGGGRSLSNLLINILHCLGWEHKSASILFHWNES